MSDFMEFQDEAAFREFLGGQTYGPQVLEIIDQYSQGLETSFGGEILKTKDGADGSLSVCIYEDGSRAQILFDLYTCLAKPHFEVLVNLRSGYAQYGVGEEIDPEPEYIATFFEAMTRLVDVRDKLLGFEDLEDVL